MEQAIVDGGTGVSAAEGESKANAIHAKEKRKQRAFLELKNERRLLQALNVVEVTKPKPCSLMARCSPSPLAQEELLNVRKVVAERKDLMQVRALRSTP